MNSDIETPDRMNPSAHSIRHELWRHCLSRLIEGVVRSMVLAAMLLPPGTVTAATCNVPSGTYPTIQSAVDAPTCSAVVAAAGTYAEAVVVDRSLELTGAGSGATFIQGGVEVSAGTVTVTGFYLSGAGEALWAHSGAEVAGFDLEVVDGLVETPLFADGFEDGTTDAWAAVSP